jgi:hypothetical protein
MQFASFQFRYFIQAFSRLVRRSTLLELFLKRLFTDGFSGRLAAGVNISCMKRWGFKFMGKVLQKFF